MEDSDDCEWYDAQESISSSDNTSVTKSPPADLLLQLPLELRREIYKHALPFDMTLRRQSDKDKIELSLLLTCRQIYVEARAVLYTNNRVVVPRKALCDIYFQEVPKNLVHIRLLDFSHTNRDCKWSCGKSSGGLELCYGCKRDPRYLLTRLKNLGVRSILCSAKQGNGIDTFMKHLHRLFGVRFQQIHTGREGIWALFQHKDRLTGDLEFYFHCKIKQVRPAIISETAMDHMKDISQLVPGFRYIDMSR